MHRLAIKEFVQQRAIHFIQYS